MKVFLLTKLKSQILVLDWFDRDFVHVHIATLSCGLPNEHRMVYVYIVL